MTALLVIAWMIIGTFGIGIGLTELLGITSREGQAGFFFLFPAGPIGAVIGAGFGYLLSRKLAGNEKAKRLTAGLSLLVIVLVPAGIFVFESVRTADLLNNSGGTSDLSWRVRLPAGVPWPAGQRIGTDLRSDKENVTCALYEGSSGIAREQDRFVFSGSCKLRYAAPKRELWFRLGGGPNLIFKLHIKARYQVVPYSASSWYKVDEVLDTAEGSKRRPPNPEEAGFEVLLSAR